MTCFGQQNMRRSGKCRFLAEDFKTPWWFTALSWATMKDDDTVDDRDFISLGPWMRKLQNESFIDQDGRIALARNKPLFLSVTEILELLRKCNLNYYDWLIYSIFTLNTQSSAIGHCTMTWNCKLHLMPCSLVYAVASSTLTQTH